MIGNYELRVVGKLDRKLPSGRLFVSTAFVTDSADPYETAVGHPQYNEGELIIVETYRSEAEARKGHLKWAARMLDTPLPKYLESRPRSHISSLLPDEYGKKYYRSDHESDCESGYKEK